MFHMIFASVAIIVLSVIVFTFWLVIMIFRGVGRLFLGPGLKQPRPVARQSLASVPPGPDFRRCERPGCQTTNPIEARFCRRCGQRLDQPNAMPVTPAAVI